MLLTVMPLRGHAVESHAAEGHAAEGHAEGEKSRGIGRAVRPVAVGGPPLND